METREELKKKIALCDKLGAKIFLPYVFKLEKLKFKILKDVFPSLQTRYERHLGRNRDKALKKAKTKEEIKQINDKYRHLIIEWRKELVREKNRNYYMDKDKPTEVIQYLNWNKRVHQRGLIKDSILITGTIIALASGLSPVFLGTLLAGEIASAFINFQCINAQNSHIYKYKLIEDNLKKREARRGQKLVENYGEAAKVYSRSISDSKDLPSLKDMIDNVKTPEEARQLRQMILSRIEANNKAAGVVDKTLQEEKIKQPTQPVIEHPQVTPQEQVVSVEQSVPEAIQRQVDLEIEKMVNEGKNCAEQSGQKHKGGN